MFKSEKTILTFILIAITATTIGIFTRHRLQQSDELPEFRKAMILPVPRTLTGVDFIDHNENIFSSDQFIGKWSILFFGYTHCPDICPTTMHALKQAKDKLSSTNRWGNYQVVMVTVDPERDTPEQLANYVPFFDPEFIGITADVETTTSFAKQLGILFIASKKSPNGSYDVDHSTALILLNPKGQMAGIISSQHKVEDISADLSSLADYYAEDHYVITPMTKTNAAKPKSTPHKNPDAITGDLQITNAWIRSDPGTK